MDFETRKVRTTQGPRKLHAEREEYFRLVKAGYSNREASRIGGVNERTGHEWRSSTSITVAPCPVWQRKVRTS